MKHVVILSDPYSGITSVHGLFENYEAAEHWAVRYASGREYTITPLKPVDD